MNNQIPQSKIPQNIVGGGQENRSFCSVKTQEEMREPNKPNLTKKQLESAVALMSSESKILGDRLNADTLAQLITQNLASVILNSQNEVVACAFLWQVENTSWYELGTCWTEKNYRGFGLAGQLFKSMANKIPKNSNAFLLSSDPSIWHLSKKSGFTQIDKSKFRDCPIEPPALIETVCNLFWANLR